MQREFRRWPTRVSRRERIKNNTIRQRMGIKNSIVEDISTKQLIWYEHKCEWVKKGYQGWHRNGFHQWGGREEDQRQNGKRYPGNDGKQALKRRAMVGPNRSSAVRAIYSWFCTVKFVLIMVFVYVCIELPEAVDTLLSDWIIIIIIMKHRWGL